MPNLATDAVLIVRLATFASDALVAEEEWLALLATPPQPATARLAARASPVPVNRQ
jgi:hypothetical protein